MGTLLKAVKAGWSKLKKALAAAWRWYKGQFAGRPWWRKTLAAIVSFFAFIILYAVAVTCNLFWLFGKSPSISEIRNPKTAMASEMYSADGKLLGKFFNENRSPVPYDSINSVFFQALISTEDERFYDHHGVDVQGLFAALKDATQGRARGASTISQQLVKNMFRVRTQYSTGLLGKVPGLSILIMKSKEMIIATELELLCTKNEILEMYANTVDFGSNAFGIKTAAKTYFNTTPSQLKPEEAAKAMAIIDEDTKTHPTDGPRGDQKEKSARLIAAVMKLKDKFFVDTFAMRCWPEVILNEFYGIAVCSTLGHLTNHGFLTACEGDVYGAVMMRIGQTLSGEKPFFCDMIVMEGDYGVAWHCGAAPCSLCKPGYQPELHCSATVEGGGVKGCTGEFPLKPGRVTLARLGETRDGDGFRMLVATGEGLDTDMFVRGTPLKIKFDAGCDALREEVINNGWEHHYALMYGDHVDELKDLCRNLGIEMHLVR